MSKKITELTEATSFSADTDLIPIVTNVGTTPLNQKMTKANFEAAISGGSGSISSQYISTSSQGAVSDADLSNGSTTFGTDNTTVLQSILDVAQTNPIVVIWDGKYSVTGLNIYSNTTIICTAGSGAILRNGSNNYLLKNNDLNLTETNYENIVDENITIIGGIWNGNGYNTGANGDTLIDSYLGSPVNGSAQYRTVGDTKQPGDFYDLLGMKGVRNLVIRDAIFYGSRNFMIGLRLCTDFLIDNCVFDFGLSSTRDDFFYDGIHLFGPVKDGVIQNIIFRKCKDDNISMVSDGSNPDLVFGAITNIFCKNITLEDTAYGFRISSSTNLIDNITIDGVHGETKDYLFVIDDLIASAGNTGTLNISNVSASVTSSPNLSEFTYMKLNGAVDIINISNWTRSDFSQNYSLVKCDEKADINVLNFVNLNYSLDETNTANVIDVNTGAIMREINIIGGNFYSSTTEQDLSILNVDGGIVTKFQIKGLLSVKGIKKIANHVSGTLTGIYADSVRHSDTTGFSFTTNGTVSDLMINGYIGNDLYSGSFSNLEGAHFNILKSYLISDLPPVTLTSEGNSKMILVNTGSTNVPCYTDGTNWINIIDGSTIVATTLDLTKIVRYYKFNNNANDSEGLGNGTPTGLTYNATGKVDDSAIFANLPSYVSIADAADLSFGNGSTDSPFSLSLWVKPSSLTGPQTLFDKRGNANDQEYQMQINGSIIRMVLFDDSASAFIDKRSVETLSTGTWQHLAFTYNGNGDFSGIKMYINGTVATYTGSTTGTYTAMESSISNAMIGDTTFNVGAADYNGELDEVTLWDEELSNAQINEIITINNAGNSLY